MRSWTHVRRLTIVAGVALISGLMVTGAAQRASAQEGYDRISGEGSSWAGIAIDAMRVNVEQFGLTVDYNPSGSTNGRKNLIAGLVDFGASDIPFQFEPEDGSEPDNPDFEYAYIPVTAGGTAFMYNLKINGQQVTNLRLSGENVAKIFTGAITMWNDPAIAADNPGLTMPARQIVPVVRSDSSGSTAQFTRWLIDQHGGIWQEYCERTGRAPACGITSNYPTIGGMLGLPGDQGVAGNVSGAQSEGAIGYVNYSYALNQGFPVVKVLNAAGYYTEPTPENVAVSLLQARINDDRSNLAVYLTQNLDGVYRDTDPRNYQLSSYSYFILPLEERPSFDTGKGRSLGAFTSYAMCQAQQQSAALGYSPIPINLVEKSLELIRRIPGAEVGNIDIRACDNPTFSPDGHNLLADNAPRPQECDKAGNGTQCPDGTAGMRNQPTAVNSPGVQPGGGDGNDGGGDGVGAGDGGGNVIGAGDSEGNGGNAGVGPNTGGNVNTGSTGNTGSGGATGSASGSITTGTGSTPLGSTGAIGTGSTVPNANANANANVAVDGASTGTDCDPDTGICGSVVLPDGSTGQVGSNGSATGVPQQSVGTPIGNITPTTLPQDAGWGTAALLVVVVLFTLALIVGPAAAWAFLTKGAAP